VHDTLAAFMFHSIGSLFKFNLLLQIFDGLFTYHVVSQQGVPEANPLVRNTIYEWGVVWGIVYWKLFACALLGLIFALRHRKYTLTFQALTVTSAVYGSFFLVALFFFLNHLSL